MLASSSKQQSRGKLSLAAAVVALAVLASAAAGAARAASVEQEKLFAAANAAMPDLDLPGLRQRMLEKVNAMIENSKNKPTEQEWQAYRILYPNQPTDNPLASPFKEENPSEEAKLAYRDKIIDLIIEMESKSRNINLGGRAKRWLPTPPAAAKHPSLASEARAFELQRLI